jgi:hypothetical protein
LSPLLGFLAGFLVWSFAVLVFCTTPFCQNAFVKDAGFDSKNFEEAKMQPYLVWWCNLVDKFAASGNGNTGSEEAIKDLLKPVKTGQKNAAGRQGQKTIPDANEPNQLIEPNLPAVEQAPAPHTVIPP